MSYKPRSISTQTVVLPHGLYELLEKLAEKNHDVWAQRRFAEGWRHGPRRSDEERTHPDLVPYTQLPEEEKEYDRATVIETLKAILALGYRILPPQE